MFQVTVLGIKIYIRESLQFFVSGSGKHILVDAEKKSRIANLKKKVMSLWKKKSRIFHFFGSP